MLPPLPRSITFTAKNIALFQGFLSDCYTKIYQTRPSNLTPKPVTLPIMIIGPTCRYGWRLIHPETNATSAISIPQTIGCLQSARNVLFLSVSILTSKEKNEKMSKPTPTPGRSRSRWKFTDSSSESDSGQNYRLRPTPTPTPTPQPWSVGL